MPNHLAFGQKIFIGDNFYCDSDHSVRCATGGLRALILIRNWVETSVSAAYGDNRDWNPQFQQPWVII